MKKITVNKLVSLILEEIKKPELPGEPIFFNNTNEVLGFLNLIKNNQPKEVEMAEMANIRYTARKLDTPLRIPVSELSPLSKNVPKVISKDPETNEMVEDVIIGNEIRVWPEAPDYEFLAFTNYAKPLGVDKKEYMTNLVYIPENIYYMLSQIPRTKKFGTQYTGSKLKVAPPDETEEEREKREMAIARQNEGYSKRFLHKALNRFFSQPDILDRLDVSLIPEIWGTPLRTERVTNVENRMKFGGNGWAINAEYYSVKDITDVEKAIEEIFKVRMDLTNGVENRERMRSTTKPREYANYVYHKGGNWPALQRILDKEAFKRAGEYTKKLKLLKQNIQKGEKGFNTFSKIYIEGNLVNDSEYRMRAKFTVDLNIREGKISSEGRELEDFGRSIGDIISPIYAEATKQISPKIMNYSDFTVKNYPEFFSNAAGTEGILPELLNNLGEQMLEQINPDEVIGKIMELAVPKDITNPAGNQPEIEGFQ